MPEIFRFCLLIRYLILIGLSRPRFTKGDEVTGSEGGSAILKCNANTTIVNRGDLKKVFWCYGHYGPFVSLWGKGGLRAENAEYSGRTVINQRNGDLNINNLTQTDAGEYVCKYDSIPGTQPPRFQGSSVSLVISPWPGKEQSHNNVMYIYWYIFNNKKGLYV